MKIINKDSSIICKCPIITKEPNITTVRISKEYDFDGVAAIELDECKTVAKGNDGYFLIPRSSRCADYALYYFGRHNEDKTILTEKLNMPVFGYKGDDCCYIAVVSGMSYNFALKYECKDGINSICPVFQLEGKEVYEDFKIEYFYLYGDEANYSGMARKYREYVYNYRGVKTLIEKAEINAAVSYTAESVMVRIRCGWKPAPPKVLHQTRENEPEMHVACDFDKISALLDEFKQQGIEKAEFCLVGWNISGHDGRWPEAFPVEPKLGGEKKLKALIKKANAYGYAMVCHTNHTDQYEIADCYDENNDIILKGGYKQAKFDNWSGGEMHCLCPQKGLENAKKMLPEVAKLGFRGCHYIDVLGVVYPRCCYSEEHPVSYAQAVDCALEKCRLSRKLFGSISSEGAFDFICPELDYGLYISFHHDTHIDLCDESVPFWQLVYHGSVLSNPYTDTMNCTFKTKREVLKSIEYGARPSFYYYSKFYSGNSWMGSVDCTCDNKADMTYSVTKIKEAYELYKKMSGIIYSFMDKHEKLADGVFKTSYSDGTVVTVDYNNETYSIN